ncbi:MAG: hypothetical protein ACX94B_06535 [Henriciella sp.]
MFERYRNLKLAVGVFGLIVLALSVYGWMNFKSYQREHAYEREKASEYYASGVGENEQRIEPPVAGDVKTQRPTASNYAAYYDLKAQQDMAEWAYSLLWVGIIGLLTSIVGVAFVYQNLREMRNQTRATREIGENQSKAYAWVAGVSVAFPDSISEEPKELLTRLPGKPNIRVQLEARNAGDTPAVQVSAWGTLRIFSGNSQNAFNPIKLEYQENPSGEPNLGTINKGQPEFMWLFIPDNRNVKRPDAKAANVFGTRNWFEIYGTGRFVIEGVLQYRDVFRQWHQSPFNFWGYVNNDGVLKPAIRDGEPVILFQKVRDPRLPNSQDQQS